MFSKEKCKVCGTRNSKERMTCSKCGGRMRIESDIHGTYWGCMCGNQIDIKPSYSYSREVCATLPIGLRHRVVDIVKDNWYD